jgi:hypothetical protein
MNKSNKKIIYQTAKTGEIYAYVISTTIKYDKCGMAWFIESIDSIEEVKENQ